MKKQISKGFTIIELLVVVAIIAVLTGIVLVNVTQYINRGKNSSIKGNLSSILTNSAVWFDANGTYTSFCSNTTLTLPETAANNTSCGSSTCVTTQHVCAATAFCDCVALTTTTLDPAGSTFCIDSTGAKKETTTNCLSECQLSNGMCQ